MRQKKLNEYNSALNQSIQWCKEINKFMVSSRYKLLDSRAKESEVLFVKSFNVSLSSTVFPSFSSWASHISLFLFLFLCQAVPQSLSLCLSVSHSISVSHSVDPIIFFSPSFPPSLILFLTYFSPSLLSLPYFTLFSFFSMPKHFFLYR